MISTSGSGQLARSFVRFHTQSARLELNPSGSPRNNAFVINPCAEASAKDRRDHRYSVLTYQPYSSSPVVVIYL